MKKDDVRMVFASDEMIAKIETTMRNILDADSKKKARELSYKIHETVRELKSERNALKNELNKKNIIVNFFKEWHEE